MSDDKPVSHHHQYLILGAGPAGLQLGYYLHQTGRDYLILEAGDTPGTFFKRFPRHRTLISSNKVHTGYDDPEVRMRFDWNSLLSDDYGVLFKDFSQQYFPPADVLVEYLQAFARHFGLKVRCGARAERIGRDGRFRVETANGEVLTCDRLIVATGLYKPYLPPIAGIELAESYTEVSVDPADFVDQKVLVIGKGNSGFETADNLISTAAVIHVASPQPVSFAWKTHYVGHLRAVNNNFLDTYQLKTQNAVLDASIVRIARREDGRYTVAVSYTHASEECEELIYDRVIACTGFRFDAAIFDESARPALTLNDRFPDQTSAWESVNVKDLYFAGTLSQMRDFKKATSGFIHGFRYNAQALHRILDSRYHGVPWPSRVIAADPAGLADASLARINQTSALWQQFGFLGDLIVVDGDGRSARYYPELPVAFLHDSDFGQSADYYVLTLEFGKVQGDPFSIKREPVPEKADRSVFLHPVIRHYSGDRLLSEHHVLENLYGEWRDEHLHIVPLHAYFTREIMDLRGALPEPAAEAGRAAPLATDTLRSPAAMGGEM
ncbi:MAG TPA: NAD(P)-binding domain-containing protein [Thermoanaerobaculia bacterium]|nr:NAD(P)-binding domain-containing protein [Thermoanaerobaculia bacterium]